MCITRIIRMSKNPSMGFFDVGTGKCDFPPVVCLLFLLALLPLPLTAVAGEQHAGEQDAHVQGQHEEGEEGHAEELPDLDATARSRLGIETLRLEPRSLYQLVRAPGEVVINRYRSVLVTPRITAQVTGRYARLGDHVSKGQRLVTLSSVAMAEAQGELLTADREWRRVRKLGREVVSDKRYVAAQVARQQALARVLAYGMTRAQVNALLKRGDVSRATGDFDLFSGQEGTVLEDAFLLGEVVEPGRVLFRISDESVIWVEAGLSPADAGRVAPGSTARITAEGLSPVEGRVTLVHHQVDERTRTRAVRIEVENRDEQLHPGTFVEVAIDVGEPRQVLAVPLAAVVLLQGEPVVFRLEGKEIHPQAVELGESRGGWREVLAGLQPGDEVVVRGAYILKSLLLKSQLGEGHAH